MPKATGLAAERICHHYRRRVADGCKQKCAVAAQANVAFARSPDVIVLAFGEGSVPVPDHVNVRFTGSIRDRRDLAQLFAAADVFVSASLMETYGLTLVEAMACGTPVVAFRVGGIPEAAPEGQAGILCKPSDGTEFRAAIEKLRRDPQLRDQLGTAQQSRTHSERQRQIRPGIQPCLRRMPSVKK